MKRLRVAVAGLLLACTAGALGCQMNRKPALGLQNGRLMACPDSPNCVCSHATDPRHQIDPFPASAAGMDAVAILSRVIAATPRATVTETRPDYLRAEFRSRVFRFVDDVEFLVDEHSRVIHVRSASRVGYSDLGVNRKRIESLRAAYSAASAAGR